MFETKNEFSFSFPKPDFFMETLFVSTDLKDQEVLLTKVFLAV